jgi:succinate dehydrogenase/fumarate reductase flavoprotein subunit
METRIQGLYAAGEAVGGANGANRLSGNAITEALVFGERAGACAGEQGKRGSADGDAKPVAAALQRIKAVKEQRAKDGVSPIALQTQLQKIMWDKAGPFRTGDKLAEALARIREMCEEELPRLTIADRNGYDMDLQDWFELRAMLATAEAVVKSALARTESRGAHQREDYPDADEAFLKNQALELKDRALAASWLPPVQLSRRQK